MTQREREILERSVHAVAEQAAKADDLVNERLEAGADASDPIVVHAKLIRLELLKVKGDLERDQRHAPRPGIDARDRPMERQP